MDHELYIHGRSSGEGESAGAGVWVRDAVRGEVIHEAGYYLHEASADVAAYQSLIRALQALAAAGSGTARIHTDSVTLARQLTGQWPVRSEALRPLLEKSQRLLLAVDGWLLRTIAPAENSHADQLARAAIEAREDVVRIGQAASEPGPASSTAPSAAPEGGDRAPRPWFTAALLAEPNSACPAPPPAGKLFPFGPSIPGKLCLYAAQTVLGSGQAFISASAGSEARMCCIRCGTRIAVGPP